MARRISTLTHERNYKFKWIDILGKNLTSKDKRSGAASKCRHLANTILNNLFERIYHDVVYENIEVEFYKNRRKFLSIYVGRANLYNREYRYGKCMYLLVAHPTTYFMRVGDKRVKVYFSKHRYRRFLKEVKKGHEYDPIRQVIKEKKKCTTPVSTQHIAKLQAGLQRWREAQANKSTTQTYWSGARR